MNNREFILFTQTLNQLSEKFRLRGDVPFKFLYGLKKNISIVLPHALFLQNKFVKPPTKFPEQFEKYDSERMNLCIKLSDKDDNGNPKKRIDHTGQEMWDIPNLKMNEFNFEMEKIAKSCPDVIQEIKDHENMVNEVLLECAPEVALYKINISNFPDDGITSEQIEILFPIIDETEESKLIRVVN